MVAGVTIIHEPEGIETLDMQPAHCHSWNEKEYVRVGVPEPGDLISLVIAHFGVDWKPHVLQALLTAAEADELIAALQEAKRRLRGEA